MENSKFRSSLLPLTFWGVDTRLEVPFALKSEAQGLPGSNLDITVGADEGGTIPKATALRPKIAGDWGLRNPCRRKLITD
jgi:hypothetical protein